MADVVANNNGENFYSIEAPGVLRSNSKYNVAVTLLQANEPCTIRLNLSGENYNDEKTLELQPLTTEIVTFDIPELEAGDYFFEATGEGAGALNFNQKIKLNFAEYKPLTYIQLDKQIYKRNDQIDFRVFFLDNNIRPAEITKPIKITIKQDANIAAEFLNIELTTGIYTGQWTIPDDISSGIYDIEVQMDEKLIVRKNFEILDFHEPKFNIQVNGPHKVRYDDEFINIGIEASYADGTPVQGHCTIHIRSIAGYFGVVEKPIEKYMHINGKIENIIYSIVDDFNVDKSFITEPYFSTALLSLDVTVLDEVNNISESLTDILTITQNDQAVVPERDCQSCGGWRSAYAMENENSTKQIFIKNLCESPKLGEPMLFEVHLNKPTNYFVYVFTARGNVIKSELVNLEEGSTKHTISLNAEFLLVPRAFLLAYYVFEGELYFDEIGFDFEHEFENKLTINAPSTIDAGKEITIEINSDPNSLVGIMAVDIKSKLAEHKNDIESKDLFEAIYKIRSQTPWLDGYGEYPGLLSGLVTFTNAVWQGFEKGDPEGWMQNMSDREHMNFVDPKRNFDLHRMKKNVLRKILEKNQSFGNLMFFNKETDDNGNLTINEILPDKSTTWLLTVFAVHPRTGFTMTKCPLKIEAKSENETDEEPKGLIEDLSSKLITKRIKFEADLYDESEFSYSLDVELPENTIPLNVEFTIESNLLGTIIAEIAKYPVIMYCTGMLHMTTFLPNVVVLEFLQNQHQLDTELVKNITIKFDEAIQRELSERRDDGSFGWFSSDKEGSPHVSATVVNALQRVSKFVPIDPNIIKEGLDYLVARQTDAGDFIREVEAYKMPFQPGLGVGLTATVLLAFIENKENIPIYQNTIDRAIDYIVTNLAATKCGYDLALAFYALQKIQHPIAVELKERLFNIAHQDETKNLKWWTYAEIAKPDANYYAPVSDMEVTSYILLGLLETDSIASLVPIVKWLLPYSENTIQFRPESMDCAISLDAVLNFAIKSDTFTGVTNIEFIAFNEEGEEYKRTVVVVEPKNANIIKTYMLSNETRKISYSTKDKGSFFGNLTYRYVEN